MVLVLGADPSSEHESLDRLDVMLPGVQSELALAILQAREAAAAVSPPPPPLSPPCMCTCRRELMPPSPLFPPSPFALAAPARSSLQQRRVILILVNYGEISTEELLPRRAGAEFSATPGNESGVDALLMAFWPGTGTPIAEAVMGAINPGGKLPYTVYPNNYTKQVFYRGCNHGSLLWGPSHDRRSRNSFPRPDRHL